VYRNDLPIGAMVQFEHEPAILFALAFKNSKIQCTGEKAIAAARPEKLSLK
jgi:hypothetical protein